MVCFQTKNTNLGKFWRALYWKMFIYVFHGHLEYFMDIGDILWLFGTFCVHFVHFSGFGSMYQEKSGNPATTADRKCAAEKFQRRQCLPTCVHNVHTHTLCFIANMLATVCIDSLILLSNSALVSSFEKSDTLTLPKILSNGPSSSDLEWEKLWKRAFSDRQMMSKLTK
jgi:hypothetical protein